MAFSHRLAAAFLCGLCLCVGGDAAAQSRWLFDSDWFLWDVHERYGRIGNGLWAFDGFGELRIVVGGDEATYYSSGARDIEVEAGGQELVFPVEEMLGLEVSRKVYVSGDRPFCRFMETLHNPTETTIVVDVSFEGDLDSDASTAVYDSSDGDDMAERTDRWFVTDDGNTDPAIGFLTRGFGRRRPSSVVFSEGYDADNDRLSILWQGIEIRPGATVTLVNIVTQQDTVENAANLVDSLGHFEGTAAEADLVDAERGTIYNYSLTPGSFLGTTMEFAVNQGGSFVVNTVGLRRTGDADWITQSPAFEGWVLESELFRQSNRAPAEDDDMRMYMSWLATTGPTLGVRQQATTSNVQVEQTITHVDGENLSRVDLSLWNRSSETISDFQYLRAIDPDQDFAFSGDTATENDVIDGTEGGVVVTATGVAGGLALGLVTTSSLAEGAVLVEPWPTDPDPVAAAPRDPDGAVEDGALFLVWDLGPLDPDESTAFSFYYIVGASQAEVLSSADELGISIPGVTDRDEDGHFFGDDCNDGESSVYPGAAETCNHVDDDCNEAVDDGVGDTYYLDVDGDEVGTDEHTVRACWEAPEGYVATSGDCDDDNITTYPGAPELCDDEDNDCDDEIDEGIYVEFWRDADGDGFGGATMSVEDCAVPPGYSATNDDCDDRYSEVNPEAPERCDFLDNNCNNQIDEELDTFTFYRDADGDGRGNPDETTQACAAPEGYADIGDDCDDMDQARFPTNPEICDEIDNDCDDDIDEDDVCAAADGDGDADADIGPDAMGDGDMTEDGAADGDADVDADVDADADTDGDQTLPPSGGGLVDKGCSCQAAPGSPQAISSIGLLVLAFGAILGLRQRRS